MLEQTRDPLRARDRQIALMPLAPAAPTRRAAPIRRPVGYYVAVYGMAALALALAVWL